MYPNSRNFNSQRSSGFNRRPRPRSSGGRSAVGFSNGKPIYRSGGGGRNRFASGNFDVRRFIAQSQNARPVEVPVYQTQHKFTDFKIGRQLLENILRRGYTEPTPIQDQAIPMLLEGKDIVGIANTGTGKSGAFLIPALNKVMETKTEKVMIIVPTRELAIQINDELTMFAKGMYAPSVICVGGVNIHGQILRLRKFHNFVIGTPGRLKDLHQRKAIHLGQYSTIVLDEVDRMLDMGFITDMQFLIAQMPTNRQSLFFSATMTPAVEKIMRDFAQDYIKISVKTGDTAANVNQEVIEVTSLEDKVAKLKELINTPELHKAIIFVATKRTADKLERILQHDGFDVDAIHGDKRQSYRTRVMRKLKENKIKALIATDVAARGIDVSGLSHVINFDIPNNSDDYAHRIGRVGRANNSGTAITLVQKF